MSLTVPALQLALNSSEKSILSIGLRTFCAQVLTQTGSLNSFGFFGLPRPSLVRAAAKKLVFTQESWVESTTDEEESSSGSDSEDEKFLEPFSPYRSLASFESDLYMFSSKTSRPQGLLENYLTASPQLEEFFVLFNLQEEEKSLEIEFFHLKALCVILHCTLHANPQVANYISSRILQNHMASLQKHLESKTRSLIAATLGLLVYMSRALQGVPDAAFHHIVTTGVVGRTLMHFRKVKKDKEADTTASAPASSSVEPEEAEEESTEAGQKRKQATEDETTEAKKKTFESTQKEEPDLDDDDDWEVRSLVTLFVFTALDLNHLLSTPGSPPGGPQLLPIQRVSQDDKVFRHLSKDLSLSKSATSHLFFSLFMRLLAPFSPISQSVEVKPPASSLHALREGLPKILSSALLAQVSELSQVLPLNLSQVLPTLQPLTHTRSHVSASLPPLFFFLFPDESRRSSVSETMKKFEAFLTSQVSFDPEQRKVLDSNFFLVSVSLLLSSLLSPALFSEYFLSYDTEALLSASQIYTLPKRVVVQVAHSLFDCLKCAQSSTHRSLQLLVVKSHPLSLRKAIFQVKTGAPGTESREELWGCIAHLTSLLAYVEVDPAVSAKIGAMIEAQQSSALSLSSFRAFVLSTVSLWFPPYVCKKEMSRLLSEGTGAEKSLALRWVCAVMARVQQQFFAVFSQVGISATHRSMLEQVISESLSELLPEFGSLFLWRQKIFEHLSLLRPSEENEEVPPLGGGSAQDMDLEINWGDEEVKPPTLSIEELAPTRGQTEAFGAQEAALLQRSYFCALSLYSLVLPSYLSRTKIDTLKLLDDFLAYFDVSHNSKDKLDLQLLPPQILFSLLHLMLSLTRSGLCPWFSRAQLQLQQGGDELSKPFSLVLVRSDWEIGLQSAASSSSSLVILLSLALDPAFIGASPAGVYEEVLRFTHEVLLSSGLFAPHQKSWVFELEAEALQWAKIACDSATHALTIFTLVRFALNCPRLIIEEAARIAQAGKVAATQGFPFSPLVLLAALLSKGHLQLFKYALPGYIQAYIDALYETQPLVESTSEKKGKTKEEALTFFSKFRGGFRQSVSNSLSLLVSRLVPSLRSIVPYLQSLSLVMENIPSPLGEELQSELAFSRWAQLVSPDTKGTSVSSKGVTEVDSLNTRILSCVQSFQSFVTTKNASKLNFLDQHWPAISVLWYGTIDSLSPAQDAVFDWLLSRWKGIFKQVGASDNIPLLLAEKANPFDLSSLLFFALYSLCQSDRILLNSFKGKADSQGGKGKVASTLKSLIKFSKKECVSCYNLTDFLCSSSLALTAALIRLGSVEATRSVLDFLLDCDYVQESLLHDDAFGSILRQILSFLLDAKDEKICSAKLNLEGVQSNTPGFLWPQLIQQSSQTKTVKKICSLKFEPAVLDKLKALSESLKSQLSLAVSSVDPSYCLLLASLVDEFKKHSELSLARGLKEQLCSIRLGGVEARLATFSEHKKKLHSCASPLKKFLLEINDASLQMLKYASFATLYKILAVFCENEGQAVYAELASLRASLKSQGEEDEGFSEWLGLTLNSLMPQLDLDISGDLTFFEPCVLSKSFHASSPSQVQSFLSAIRSQELTSSQVYVLLSSQWGAPLTVCFPHITIKGPKASKGKLNLTDKSKWDDATLSGVLDFLRDLYKGKEHESLVSCCLQLLLDVSQTLASYISTGKKNENPLSKKELRALKEFSVGFSSLSLNICTFLAAAGHTSDTAHIPYVFAALLTSLNSSSSFEVKPSPKSSQPYVLHAYASNTVSIFSLSPHLAVSLYLKVSITFVDSSSSLYSSLNKLRQAEDKSGIPVVQQEVEKKFQLVQKLLSISQLLSVDSKISPRKGPEEEEEEVDLNVDSDEENLVKDSEILDLSIIGVENIFPSLFSDLSGLKKSLLKLIRITLKSGYGEHIVSRLLETVVLSVFSQEKSFFQLFLSPSQQDFFHPSMMLQMIQTHSQYSVFQQSSTLILKGSGKSIFSTHSLSTTLEGFADSQATEVEDLELQKSQRASFNNLLRLCFVLLSVSLSSFSKETLPEHFLGFYNTLKAIYQGSTSLKDRLVLRILFLFDHYKLSPSPFSSLPIAESGVSGDLTYSNLCEFIKVGRVNQTLSSFPVWRSSNQPFLWEEARGKNYPDSEHQHSLVQKNLEAWGVENLSSALLANTVETDSFEDTVEFLYDPAYFLPLFYIILCRPMKVKPSPEKEAETPYFIRQFIVNGGLSLVLSSLSLSCPLLRSLALSLLQRISVVVEKQGVDVDSLFKERGEVTRILQYVHDAIVTTSQGPFKIPPHVGIFLGKALQSILQPRHELFRTTNSYLNLRPFLDVNDVPLFDQVVMDLGAFASSNSSANSNSFPSVLLTVLRQLSHSLLTPLDHQNYSRKNVYSRCAALLPLVQSDSRVVNYILDFFDASLSLKKSSMYFVERLNVYELFFVNTSQALKSAADTSIFVLEKQDLILQQGQVSAQSTQQQQVHQQLLTQINNSFAFSTRYLNLLRKLWAGTQALFLELHQLSTDSDADEEEKQSLSRLVSVSVVNCGSTLTSILNLFLESPQLFKVLFSHGLLQSKNSSFIEILHVLLLFIWEYFSAYKLMVQASSSSDFLSAVLNNTNSVDPQVLHSFIALIHTNFKALNSSDPKMKQLYFSTLLLLSFLPETPQGEQSQELVNVLLKLSLGHLTQTELKDGTSYIIHSSLSSSESDEKNSFSPFLFKALYCMMETKKELQLRGVWDSISRLSFNSSTTLPSATFSSFNIVQMVSRILVQTRTSSKSLRSITTSLSWLLSVSKIDMQHLFNPVYITQQSKPQLYDDVPLSFTNYIFSTLFSGLEASTLTQLPQPHEDFLAGHASYPMLSGFILELTSEYITHSLSSQPESKMLKVMSRTARSLQAFSKKLVRGHLIHKELCYHQRAASLASFCLSLLSSELQTKLSPVSYLKEHEEVLATFSQYIQVLEAEGETQESESTSSSQSSRLLFAHLIQSISNAEDEPVLDAQAFFSWKKKVLPNLSALSDFSPDSDSDREDENVEQEVEDPEDTSDSDSDDSMDVEESSQ